MFHVTWCFSDLPFPSLFSGGVFQLRSDGGLHSEGELSVPGLSICRLQQESDRPEQRTVPLREVQQRVPKLQIQTPALCKRIQCTSLRLVWCKCSWGISSLTHSYIHNLITRPLHPCLSDSQANLADFGDNQWVTFFQETAEVLLGQSAETLGELRETVRHTHTQTYL